MSAFLESVSDIAGLPGIIVPELVPGVGAGVGVMSPDAGVGVGVGLVSSDAGVGVGVFAGVMTYHVAVIFPS